MIAHINKIDDFTYTVSLTDFKLVSKACDLAVIRHLLALDELELFEIINEIVNKDPTGCILFSGGTDSKFINAIRGSRDYRVFFNLDSEYEPNNKDEFSVKESGLEIKIIKPVWDDVEAYLESDNYEKDLLSVVGYSHNTF